MYMHEYMHVLWLEVESLIDGVTIIGSDTSNQRGHFSCLLYFSEVIFLSAIFLFAVTFIVCKYHLHVNVRQIHT